MCGNSSQHRNKFQSLANHILGDSVLVTLLIVFILLGPDLVKHFINSELWRLGQIDLSGLRKGPTGSVPRLLDIIIVLDLDYLDSGHRTIFNNYIAWWWMKETGSQNRSWGERNLNIMQRVRLYLFSSSEAS